MAILIFILLVSAVTLPASLAARRMQSPEALIALYVLLSALSQILAVKIAVFDFGFMQVTAPAATIIFAVTFLVSDIVNEKFGRRAAWRMVALSFALQILMTVLIAVATVLLPPAPFWHQQGAWESIFGMVPRIMLASWVAFLLSESFDVWLYDRLRRFTHGRHLWLRNALSSIPALTLDTLLFVTLAFVGTGLELRQVFIGLFLTKYAVALLDIPFMYLNRALMGERQERA